ncbi:hypothetical protein VQL36_08950 [Chengkuizengella sp. SCS-71B]|uniref:hypothetical protein n=1 Tax=Chengkuizengella sp. SCS-71B TaxID=3115290 RepID=UPI0032C237A9
MGVFDESICDCCVCPMQCVLKELMDMNQSIDDIFTVTGSVSNPSIIEVRDFIVFTDQGVIPISKINFICLPVPSISLNLKPIKKSTGDCSCCEDPTTNLANSLKGEVMNIEIIGFGFDPFKIADVGEGVIIGEETGNQQVGVISSCFVTRIFPL